MAEPMITVEVVYALADQQWLVSLSLPQGVTAREAVLQSGLAERTAPLDLTNAALGIFGKTLAKPEERILKEGERVEIYRPLVADPKEVRKQRAARAALAKAGEPR